MPISSSKFNSNIWYIFWNSTCNRLQWRNFTCMKEMLWTDLRLKAHLLHVFPEFNNGKNFLEGSWHLAWSSLSWHFPRMNWSRHSSNLIIGYMPRVRLAWRDHWLHKQREWRCSRLGWNTSTGSPCSPGKRLLLPALLPPWRNVVALLHAGVARCCPQNIHQQLDVPGGKCVHEVSGTLN